MSERERNTLHRKAKRLLRRACYEEAWNVCRELSRSGWLEWWPAHAVTARVLLEWGKAEDDQDRLHEAVKCFDTTLALIHRSQTTESDDFTLSAVTHGDRSLVRDRVAADDSADDSDSESVTDREKTAREMMELHNDRGVALLELDEFVDARSAFEYTLTLNPQHDRALCNLGLVHWAEGREGIALATFDRAIESNNRNAHTFNNRGALRAEWGEHESAYVFGAALLM